MKKIGILGGLSPQSTINYYKLVNAGVEERLGKGHSARILLSSVNFGEFCRLKKNGDWKTRSDLLCAEAIALEKGGADFIILATNTMHMAAEKIRSCISVPFLHLVEATARYASRSNLSPVGFLGTMHTIELGFYHEILAAHGIKMLVPDKVHQEKISTIIYEELARGKVLKSSRKIYLEAIESFVEKGAKGVILGCAEIPILIGQKDTATPLLDTVKIHVDAVIEELFIASENKHEDTFLNPRIEKTGR